jgi:putative oxidoreductase
MAQRNKAKALKRDWRKNKKLLAFFIMKDLLRLFFLNFIPGSRDLGLLLLRLVFGVYMLTAHGWPKLIGFAEKSEGFPDPFGIGSPISLALAVAFEVLGSICLILGVFTRFSALAGIVTMTTAFVTVHHMIFIGKGNGELAFVYLTVYLVLFLSGGGRYALDNKLGAKS